MTVKATYGTHRTLDRWVDQRQCGAIALADTSASRVLHCRPANERFPLLKRVPIEAAALILASCPWRYHCQLHRGDLLRKLHRIFCSLGGGQWTIVRGRKEHAV